MKKSITVTSSVTRPTGCPRAPGGVSYFFTNPNPVPPVGPTSSPAGIGANFRYVLGTPFTTGLAAALQGNQAATLTLDVQSTQNVVVFGGFAIQQEMIGSLIIRRNTPYLGKDLLLRVDFTAKYQGTNGGSLSNLAADVSVGDSVTFSSDFISFSGSSEENMNLAFTSVSPQFIRDIANQAIQSFLPPAHGPRQR